MRLRLFLFIAAAAAPASAAPAGNEADLAAFERAMAGGDLRVAGDTAKRIRLARQRPGQPVGPDPLLSGLYGRLMLLSADSARAIAFLEQADGPGVPPAQRAAAALALAEARERVGDYAGAQAALGGFEAGAADAQSRRKAALAAARLRLVADPRAALSGVAGLTAGDWEAELIAAQAHSLAGDAAAARLAADRAWVAAASAPAEETAPLRVALLRGGLAAAAGRRPELIAMLGAAGAAGARLQPRAADYLPICGEEGLGVADEVTLAAWHTPSGPNGLMAIAATRLSAIEPFLDALAGRNLIEGPAISPVGVVFTARCRSHVSGAYDLPRRKPGPWAEWLASRGLYVDLAAHADAGASSRLSEEIDSLARARGDDYPPLIPMRLQLVAWLMVHMMMTGELQGERIAELRRKVTAAMRKLDGAEALIPPEDLASQEQALMRAGSSERFLDLLRAAREKRAAWLPLDEAYSEVQQWFETDPPLPAETRIRVLRALLARFAAVPGDLRRRAILLRLGQLLRSEGQEREAMASYEEVGLAVDMCPRLTEPPNVVAHPIDDRVYPPDALNQALQGTTTVEFEVSPEGRVAGHRFILAAPAAIFDSVVAEGLPGFRLTPPKSGGRARRCRAYVQSIHWRVPPETETGLPSFTEPGLVVR